jgi:regulator of sirC expression with transglutaminase-like and TPR domain
MSRIVSVVLAAGGLVAAVQGRLVADDSKTPSRTIEQLAEAYRKSVVVVTVRGREGNRQGLGTGFVVSRDGLIATNLHVIGEGRPVSVQLTDGTRHEVTSVHAWDRALDLALVRIKARDLSALELGESATVKQGQPVVVLGNPLGLERSVVAGVVSGTRDIDGRWMLQLAVPIEPGNSGGPVLDMRGRVLGLVTLKSQVSANLGFAVGIDSLKPLLRRPNPVPMTRWLSFGTLDPHEWRPLLGADWRRRGGRILVDSPGTGFGGRSLCLWEHPVPPVPFEVAVTVRLDDEAGAAGVVFGDDDGHRHYGFYPSGGQLRLTRFDGPDVFSWTILRQGPSADYRPGDWNTLKVRLENGHVRCFVNGRPVFELVDVELAGKGVGLTKFRQTHAEFKDFRVGRDLAPSGTPDDVVKRIMRAAGTLANSGTAAPGAVSSLAGDAPVSVAVLRGQARALEEEAARLRRLASAVQERRVLDELAKAAGRGEGTFDLVRAVLLLARLDDDELDVDAYRQEVADMARDLAGGLPERADDQTRFAALNRYFFTDRGFHGSHSDYYNRANSYLNEVIDDREGLPITLSILYLELARGLGLKMVGVGLPGHFVVRYLPREGDPRLIDVFDGGQVLSRHDADAKVREYTGRPISERDLAAAGEREILVRVLHNLVGVAQDAHDRAAMLRYLNAILTVTPEAFEDRGMRAMLLMESGRKEEALRDADWLIEHPPEGVAPERLIEFRQLIERGGR